MVSIEIFQIYNLFLDKIINREVKRLFVSEYRLSRSLYCVQDSFYKIHNNYT